MVRRRRATSANPWSGEQRDTNVDALFDGMRVTASQELGRDDISIGNEANAHWVGLPLPALAPRYLFQSTGLPLSRIIQITGEEGSCKSSLLFEIMRWHHVYGGGSVFIENENKDSPELRYGILQWNDRWLRRHEKIPTFVLEEWQDALTKFVHIARTQQDLANGPGHTIPICFGIDSLMSTPPRELLDKITKDGHASRNFPIAARLISEYMRTMPALLQTYPFTIVGTNHLKPSTDYQGRPTNQIPGGKSVKFMETYEIEMHRAPAPDVDRSEEGGIRLRLVARKNAIGPSRKQIVAELLWRFDTASGVMRQYFAWDWATASTELLLSFENVKGKKTLYNRIMEICPIRVVSKTARRAKCEPLGFTKDNPGTYREIGQALERHPEILEQLYPLLGITQHAYFQPGIDYRDTLEARDAEVARRALTLYGNLDDMPVLDADALDPTGTAVPPNETDYEDDDPEE